MASTAVASTAARARAGDATTADASPAPYANAPRAAPYANAARAVEDPGECAPAASSLWRASSWFARGVDDAATVANADATPYGDDARAARAPGGATCLNRFVAARGARDPFAPASASATLAATPRDDAATRDRAWTRGRVWMDARGARDARGGRARGFGGGAARRVAERAPGATFAYDVERRCWTMTRDGTTETLAVPAAVDARASTARAGGEDAREADDARDGDGDGDATRRKTREARVVRYQASYDACAARVVDRARAREDGGGAATSTRVDRNVARRAATTTAAATTAAATTPAPATATTPAPATAATTTAATSRVTWIPLTCDGGRTVWIEASATIDPNAQLASWIDGDAPWPVVRTLDLGRDRAARGIPSNAPGPVCEDARALAEVEVALRRRHEENVARAAAPTARARAVDPTNADAVDAAGIIDTLVRASAAPAARDGDASLSIAEQRALRAKLESTIREKHAALAECARLRDLLRRADVEP